MINRKGLSSIVATVLLISLTIAAVVLIMAFLFPFIKGIWKSGTECYDYIDYYTFDDEIGFNCYQLNSGIYKYAISISADSSNEELDNEIKGIDLIFSKEGETLTKMIEDGIPIESNFRMIDPERTTIRIPKNGESFTYIFESEEDFESASIYPQLKSERKCDKTDTIYIRNMMCQNEIP